jgi:catechol 2,3-dioxygenase-like lactoylglutathione lyase family enzyme
MEHKAIQRMEHVGIVVDDLAAATEFFVKLGLELQGEAPVEFNIEVGTNEMAPNWWQSFFTIEKHGDSGGKSELFFLEPT